MICITVRMLYSRLAGKVPCRPGGTESRKGTRMELTVKITPRVAAQVARRLRLAASVRTRSMPAMASDALDEALPGLEEIRMQLTLPAAETSAAGLSPDLRLGPDGPVLLTRGGPAVSPARGEGTGDGSGR
jgi:plasmid stability protein